MKAKHVWLVIPGEWGIGQAEEIVRDWTTGGLYPKSIEKAVNHVQQRSELTCIWESLLRQQSGEWTAVS